MRRLTKSYWHEVREQIQLFSPQLVEIIDKLSPDASYPVYIASYPFGSIIGDETRLYYPLDNGELGALAELPKDIQSDLAYAGASIPMGMILSNATELYIEDFGVCIPHKLQIPGTFFGLFRELDAQHGSFHPSGLLKMTAGARSMFMLPNIGDNLRYSNLQRDYKLKTKYPPNDLYDHWKIFKDIYQNKATPENTWTASLLYFSKKWVDKIQNDKKWKELKLYLIEEQWRNNLYQMNSNFFELIFSLTQAKQNLKPNPYLADITRYLLSMAVGSSPGFVAASNEIAAPIKMIQKAFLDSYGLKYAPVIMHIGYLNSLYDHVYYGLQYPITMAFSPSSRRDARTIIELRELKHITDKLLHDIKKPTSVCKNTIAHKVVNQIVVDFFHNKSDTLEEINLTSAMPLQDPWLQKSLVNDDIMPFADSGAFVRGCVRLSRSKV